MTAAPLPKTERLLKLLIMLLVQRHYIPKDRIRAVLYEDASDDSFEKMFERDKEELRSLGVPIEVGSIDAYFDDEPGYRISPDKYALPDIDLSADEATVIGLAARVWEHATLAKATTDVVRKLTAGGVEVDVGALEIAQPRLNADEPSFDFFLGAVQQRQPVQFDYQRAGEAQTQTRHLQPWGVTRYSGRWYVVGHDVDRGAERVFRLSRLRGTPKSLGKAGSYDVPDDVDLGDVAHRMAPPPAHEGAVLLARTDAALPLRTAAESTESGVLGPDGTSDWDRLFLRRGSVGLADEVLGYGPDVYVEQPAGLREEVVQRLRGVLV